MKPLIAITCSRGVGGAWGDSSPGHLMDFAYEEYSRAVRNAGGAPLLMPISQSRDTLETILSRVQGIVLSGGVDINPKRYGEQPLCGMGQIDEARDTMELNAAKIAFEKDLPIFAICRGIQVLNVSLGGSLFQDIPGQVKESLLHSQNAPKNVLTHTIRIEQKTLLHKVIGKKKIWVNSKHHQAVKDVAPGLRIGARSEDGIIEAVEHPSKRFVLGVQWHPEGTFKEDTYSKKLFRAFIREAAGQVNSK